MKNIILSTLATIGAIVMLSGCVFTGQALDVTDNAIKRIPEDIGRFSSHLGVRTAEEATKQKVIDIKVKELEVEKAELEVEKARASRAQVGPVTDAQAFASAMKDMSKTMREAFKAMSKKNGAEEYGLVSTPTPKGVIGETLESAGTAIGKVADSPAALATSIGVGAVKLGRAAIKGAGDQVNVEGDQNQVSTSKINNKTKTSAKGQGVATGAPAGDTVVLPPEPEEEEEEEEEETEDGGEVAE